MPQTKHSSRQYTIDNTCLTSSKKKHTQTPLRMTESKSNLLGKSASTYLILLLKLIEKGDWYRFSQLALDEPQAFQSLSNLVSKSSGFNGMSLLHAAARYNPPSNIISKMLELCPDTIEKVDCLNRTALHVGRIFYRRLNICIFPLIHNLSDTCYFYTGRCWYWSGCFRHTSTHLSISRGLYDSRC